ncbi:MAG: phospho-N-acetylmuramoyl-pentapeptide-transferase [Muribaculaceae bacterium]|nr:phospho-N-acetylmuramoyl-pentapeptide-transferase [Muribaculaceae bacterium]
MLYYLSQWLTEYNVPGSHLFQYVTFRSGSAFVLAMLIAIFFGRRIINRLQLMQVGEIVRDLGLEGQMKKTGTPTMGGVIIILAIVVPCLLVSHLANNYMLLMLFATIWLGTIGFLDDYKKIKKHNKEGMKGKYKIIGQVGIAIVVAITMYVNPNMVIATNTSSVTQEGDGVTELVVNDNEVEKAPVTTIPFVKNHNFDYSVLTSWMGEDAAQTGGWIFFLIVTIFFVAATSNGANLTDGLDGLTTGCSAIIGVALVIMAYLGGNVIYSSYLDIMYIPGSEELVVYMAAFIGALVGFLWYNAFPAQVFMGDTGSLTLGGIIAVFAILIHKELLLPILCALFYIEDLSVMIQVAYFKATKGRRVFKMTPLHHHFQKAGNSGIDAIIQRPLQPIPESKIVIRFWIIGIILAAFTFVTLKIR